MHLAKFTANYDEISSRLRWFARLVERADAIYERLPREQRDAFYQLILYPVRGAALVNEMHLGGTSERAQKAYDQIQQETQYYNEQLAGGKWRHMMSSNPRNRPALRKPQDGTNAATATVPGGKSVTADSGFISLEAEHPTRAHAEGGTDWKVIQGLGRSGDSIALLPTSAAVPAAAALEYDFRAAQAADANVLVYCLPTQPICAGMRLRCSVSVDSGEPRVLDIATGERSKEWSTNMLRAAAIGTTGTIPVAAGKHTLRLQPLDPGVVFDKVVIDLGGLKPTHLGPPATQTPALERQ
jgi:hypothetical protein